MNCISAVPPAAGAQMHAIVGDHFNSEFKIQHHAEHC